KLLSLEKMASLGRLTAGIAHEMNSPLGAIRASLAELSELAKEYQSSLDDPNITPEDHAEIIQEMQAAILLANKAANRAAEFVRSIKSQTRDLENPVREIFNPIATVNETLLLLAHELRNSNNTISFDHPDTEISLNGSPGRFAQTISNLVMNAIEANRENGGGMINLQIEVINNVMYLQVSDSGPGISMENITKIFDPMFTTKSLSEGIGLGLTLVHDIVVGEFGGTVEVESAPGEGANFLLNFPLA
ncbi:MAG: HAMP domain-containing histidine kinase, partial [Anaerolineae bacterium]|nr:HAMP domain-containing histidine kinase [Anaerolineae bacterium]